SPGDKIVVMAIRDLHEVVLSFRVNAVHLAQDFWQALTQDMGGAVENLDRMSPSEFKLTRTRIIPNLHGARIVVGRGNGADWSLRLIFPLPKLAPAQTQTLAVA